VQATFPQGERDKNAGEWYLRYAESRYSKDERLDPTSWHQERLRLSLERKLKMIHESGYGSTWFNEWYEARKARRLHTETMLKYLANLTTFNLDPAQLTTKEIIERLSALSTETSAERYRGICVVIRTVVRQLHGRDEADKIQLPSHGPSRIVLLTKEDMDKMLGACNNLRDRLIIEFFKEMGDRRGEHVNLKIKDIIFDEYSPVIWLHGKTGERRRRIYVNKADLVSYLKCHPRKDDPNAALWYDMKTDNPIQYEGMFKIIRRIGRKALGRNIYPHMFRHTAATSDSRKYTDRELMLRHGWSSTSQIKVYSHLSMRDVDEKDLELHGFRGHEDVKGLRTCPNCKEENAAISVYCMKCGEALPLQSTDPLSPMGAHTEQRNYGHYIQ
jgi:integrase